MFTREVRTPGTLCTHTHIRVCKMGGMHFFFQETHSSTVDHRPPAALKFPNRSHQQTDRAPALPGRHDEKAPPAAAAAKCTEQNGTDDDESAAERWWWCCCRSFFFFSIVFCGCGCGCDRWFQSATAAAAATTRAAAAATTRAAAARAVSRARRCSCPSYR